GTAGEQAEADGQDQGTGSTESEQAGSDEPASDSGASSADEGSAASEAGTTSDEDASGTDDGAGGSEEGQSSGSQAEVSIGESFEDPEMQDKIEVLSAVRNFDSSKKATSIELGGEVVLLEVKITPGQKYSGLIQSGDCKIADDGRAEYRHDQTSGVAAEMKAAGYAPVEAVPRRDGGSHQRGSACVTDEQQDPYEIRYERGAGKVMGTDEKVPEFTT